MQKKVGFCLLFLSFLSPLLSGEKLTLTLDKAVEIALENNPHIQSTQELLEKARQGKLESWSQWFPRLEGSFEAYYSKKPILIFNTKTNFLSQLYLTQTLFSMEKYYAVKIAALYEEQLKLLLAAAINDLLLDVRTIYYKIIYDYESIQTAEEKVKLLVELAQRMEYNYQIGLATQYNANQSKVAIAGAQKNYYDWVKEYKVDLDSLATFLGIDPGSVEIEIPEKEICLNSIDELKNKIETTDTLFEKFSLTGPLLNPQFVKTQSEEMCKLFSKEEMTHWTSQALQYRPELRATSTAVNIAKEQVQSEKGNYYPNVNLKSNYGGKQTPFVEHPKPHFTDQSMQWAVGVELKWLLFDSLGRERKIKKAEAEKRSISYELNNLTQRTLADVRKQIFSIEKNISDFITTKANVSLAKQTLYQSKEQLEIGYINIYDYQIAVDELIQTLNTLNRSKYEIISSYYALRHASGVDIKNRE